MSDLTAFLFTTHYDDASGDSVKGSRLFEEPIRLQPGRRRAAGTL